MKLKVICQKCGKTHVEDTVKTPPSEWCYFETNDVLADLPDWLDFEFWLCPKCMCELDKLKEEESGDEVDDFFKKLLKPTKEEFEGLGLPNLKGGD